MGLLPGHSPHFNRRSVALSSQSRAFAEWVPRSVVWNATRKTSMKVSSCCSHSSSPNHLSHHSGHDHRRKLNFSTSTPTSHLREYEIKAIQEGRERLPTERTNTQRLLEAIGTDTAYSSTYNATPDIWIVAEDVLNFWSTQRSVESVHFSFQLLEKLLLQQQQRQLQEQPMPSFLNSELLLDILANWRVVSWMLHAAEDDANTATPLSPEDIQLMEKQYTPVLVWDRLQRAGRYIPLTEKMYYFVMEAQTRYHNPQAEFCEKILEDCHRNYQKRGRPPNCQPNLAMYRALFLAWSKTDLPEAPDRVQKLLQELPVPPDRRIYTRAIQTFAKHGKPILAQEYLQRMYQDFKAGNRNCRPGMDAFASVVAAWARSGAPDAGDQAESVLKEMIQLQKENDLLVDQVHGIQAVCNACIVCHSKTGTREGAEKAQLLFDEMERSRHKPDATSYFSLLVAWRRAQEPEKAEDVLMKCINDYEKGFSEVKPDSSMFGEVIRAWARSNRTSRYERAQKVFFLIESLADDTLRVDTFAYTAFIESISLSRSSGAKLVEILKQMREEYDSGAFWAAPNQYTYEAIFQGLKRKGESQNVSALISETWDLMWKDFQKGDKKVRPTLQLVNLALAGYNNARGQMSVRKESAARAVQLFTDMSKAHDNKQLKFEPDTYTYASLLSCMARGDRINEATRLLFRMREQHFNKKSGVAPNRFCYNAVMNAWAMKGKPDKVAELIKFMVEDFTNGNTEAEPRRDSFNILLKAWSNSENSIAPHKAKDVLLRMMKLADKERLDCFPDVRSFTTCITTFGKSKHPKAPEEAEALLRDLSKLHRLGKVKEGPNRLTYKYVIMAWEVSSRPDRHQHIQRLEKEQNELNLKAK